MFYSNLEKAALACKSYTNDLLGTNDEVFFTLRSREATLAGYVSRSNCKYHGKLEYSEELIIALEHLCIFRSPELLNWMSEEGNKNKEVIIYLQALETLRIALLTFVQEPFNQVNNINPRVSNLQLLFQKKTCQTLSIFTIH